jgi:hypothetical protein
MKEKFLALNKFIPAYIKRLKIALGMTAVGIYFLTSGVHQKCFGSFVDCEKLGWDFEPAFISAGCLCLLIAALEFKAKKNS